MFFSRFLPVKNDKLGVQYSFLRSKITGVKNLIFAFYLPHKTMHNAYSPITLK
jgi:hypothetical protein